MADWTREDMEALARMTMENSQAIRESQAQAREDRDMLREGISAMLDGVNMLRESLAQERAERIAGDARS